MTFKVVLKLIYYGSWYEYIRATTFKGINAIWIAIYRILKYYLSTLLYFKQMYYKLPTH